eukprot:Rhum_TRINITY_DN14732_c2_g5::Rhum_TRINITY_DN14732_c2_g5_i3::g.112147::m.112147
MLVTASWGGEDVAVEVGAECRTLAALKALLQAALPELDVEQTVLAVGGRCVADDEAVCGLEDGAVVALSPTVAARARATLRKEGHRVDDGIEWGLFVDAIADDNARICELYLDVANCGGCLPLVLACTNNSLAVCKLLIDRGSAVDGSPMYERETPLHISCAYGYLEICRLLLARGSSLEALNSCGHTPLHLSCARGHLEICKLLLDARGGGALELRSAALETPLHVACRSGKLEIARLLLDRGCSVDAETGDGETALGIAAESTELRTLLLERGAKDQHGGVTR